MKHIKDAQTYLEQGQAPEALEILEHVLGLAPRNPEALRLKAQILDSWGHFDESLSLLEKLAKLQPTFGEEEGFSLFEQRIAEDREELSYSEPTSDGRLYFSLSKDLIFISMYGLVGCLIFLFVCPIYMNEHYGFLFIALLFTVLVFAPWLILIVLNLKRVKKIFVGFQGIAVYKGRKKLDFLWSDLRGAVIEYDPNINSQYLHLMVYSKTSDEPVLNFDISKRSADMKARRHFVRLLLSYLHVVSYLPRKI